MDPDQMLVRFMAVWNFEIKKMLVFHFSQGRSVFGGVSTGGTFNLIVLSELGELYSQRHTRNKNSRGLIGKFAGKELLYL